MDKFKLLGSLNVQQQFLIAKRFGSPNILPFVDMMINGDKTKVSLLPALIMAFSRMTDEDSNQILELCLTKLFDVSSTPPAAVFRNGQIMYDDLTLTSLMNFSAELIMRDMRDFFCTVLPSLAAE